MRPRTRRALGALAILTLGLAGLGPATGPASAAAATITVTAVDSISGAALDATCVDAIPFGFMGTRTVVSACSATNVVVLAGLESGTDYTLFVQPQIGGYVGAVLKQGGPSSQPLIVTAPADITAPMVKGVRVGGTVVDSKGAPLDGSVSLNGTAGEYFGYPFSGGRWSGLVTPGTYTVEFQTTHGVWQESWAYGKRTAATADTIVISGASTTIDQVVPDPSGLSGTITDASTGAPIPGACLEVLNPAAPDFLLGYACADAAGAYVTRQDVPSGTWLVRAYDETGAHAAVSRSVQVVAGQLTSGVDFALPVAATLTGRVVDRRSGAPIQGACPYAYVGLTQEQPFLQSTACSDASGNWSLTGLPAGQLTVYLSGDAAHVGRWAADADTQAGAKLFTTTAGATTSTGTVRESHGATLTGRVTDGNGRPVVGAYVSVGIATTYQPNTGPGSGPGVTDAQGRYVITNIEPQQSVIEVQTPDATGLAWQWSGRASDPAKGKKLTFKLEGRVQYDVELRPEAVLSVTAAPTVTGSLLVDVQTLSGAGVGYHSEVSPGFPVTIHGLPASDVVVQLTGTTVGWYGGSTLATATHVSVRAGRTTSITVTAP